MRANTIADVLSKIKKTESCWLWTGVTDHGYGRISMQRKTLAAHRIAFEHFKGPIPDGLFVLHKCDNPPCCNPDHLFLGTHKDNMADCVAKGRHWSANLATCKNGHPRTPENVVRWKYSNRSGSYCKICRRRVSAVSGQRRTAAIRLAAKPGYRARPFTHCIHGHEYTAENTYLNGGAKRCVTCRKTRDEVRYKASP